MKTSAKTEYACVAMLELASRYGSGEPTPVGEIGRKHGVPSRFLVQILLQLKAAGLVASSRGATGGYQMIRPPDQVSLGEVMQLIDGSIRGSKRTCCASPDSPAVKVVMDAWQEVAAKEWEMLNGISFAELVKRAKQEDSPMYYI